MIDHHLGRKRAQPDDRGARLVEQPGVEALLDCQLCMGPGQRTPVHDHTVWRLIGMLRGVEISRDYSANPDHDPRLGGADARPVLPKILPTVIYRSLARHSVQAGSKDCDIRTSERPSNYGTSTGP